MLPRAHRMTRRSDFATAVRRGRRTGDAHLVIHLHVPTSTEPTPAPARVGFVVPKSVGNAVVRTSVARRLRHLLQPVVTALPPGALVVVRALPPAGGAASAELALSLHTTWERALKRAVRS